MAQFQENLKEEQDKTTNSGAAAAAMRHEMRRKACPTLKFTDHVDLSDSRRWKMQMSELTKLPSWARVVSAGNMLSHLGYPIQGMNTVKLTMEVWFFPVKLQCLFLFYVMNEKICQIEKRWIFRQIDKLRILRQIEKGWIFPFLNWKKVEFSVKSQYLFWFY